MADVVDLGALRDAATLSSGREIPVAPLTLLWLADMAEQMLKDNTALRASEADRDRLAAENARLREAVAAIAAAKFVHQASSCVFGEEYHALMDAIAAARSLTEAQP